MNITNEVKKHLIAEMIRHAAKRQAAPTAKAAKALDKLWRQLFAKHIELKIPEVPQARWAELIQEQIFSGMKGVVYLVTNKVGDKHNTTENTELGKIAVGYASKQKEREADKDKWDEVRRAVSAEWGGFLNFTSVYTGGYDFHYSWKTSHADLPSIRGLGHIFHPDVVMTDKNDPRLPYSKAAYQLSLQVDRLMASFLAVLKAAGEMHDDLTKILASIRTLKQLQDQFPEAVDFLPEEFTSKVRNVKQVADPRLVSRARTMLMTGIPD
ncbi:DNA polymerase [Pseudomonas phage Lana]|uniref:Uncharacterized protein n=1 Tax=Pseudomonas phage Lana TaxID=2530172 RepID=A0A481W6L1_9CAUD|nr:DNA polymerase [Pseudomonas phage Lana]QBJ04517.1 hypothetical protein [Pseudomonas phage Lana]